MTSCVKPVLAALSLLLVASCTPAIDKVETVTPVEDAFLLRPVDYAALTGWHADAQDQAVVALLKSCTAMLKRDAADTVGAIGGRIADWQQPCTAAQALTAGDTAQARAFFEQYFTPYAAFGNAGDEGLFTGYYEPKLRGALTKKAPYLTPLYARPSNMYTASLGDFLPEYAGKNITGRVEGDKFVPYYKRSEIENGALSALQNEIVWVDDPVDAFFLHIQGSGVVEMEDGSLMYVGYAAQNGHAYLAVGKALIERGALTKENVSMQTIRQWLEANPDEAASVMNLNDSYVFLRPITGEGPLGAQGVALTPQRSLAVDRRNIPYGLPVWLDAEEPEGGPRLQRLMVAQDTGGAIRGAVRGDYFWGAGDMAAHKAGLMKSKGRYFVLLPRTVTVPDTYLKKP